MKYISASYGGQVRSLMWFYVYILECANSKLYTGCTADIPKRLERHNKGHVPATKNILPVKLIAAISVPDKNLTFHLEKYLKLVLDAFLLISIFEARRTKGGPIPKLSLRKTIKFFQSEKR